MKITEILIRYIWPLILGWNIFLFNGMNDQKISLVEYKLFVAENYTSKVDLEKMFDGFEKRFDEKISMVLKVSNQ